MHLQHVHKHEDVAKRCLNTELEIIQRTKQGET